MNAELDRVICPECNTVRTKTPSGALCANGHGRLHMGVTKSELKGAGRQAWARGLPTARKNRKEWVVGDNVYRIAKFDPDSDKPKHVPTGATVSDGILAKIPGANLVIRKFEKVTA